jgi:hypothetical protein
VHGVHRESSVSLAIQYVLPHTENQHSSNLFLTYVIHHGSDSDIQGDTDTCPQCLEEDKQQDAKDAELKSLRAEVERLKASKGNKPTGRQSATPQKQNPA